MSSFTDHRSSNQPQRNLEGESVTNLLNNHAIIAKPGVREDVDRIRIIIADEHPLFRAGMRAALEREESFQVVAEAGDGDELLAYAESLTPEVVLIDVIRRASSGTYLINDSVLAKPVLASRVLSSFRELATEDQHVKPLFVPLSAREVEVLEYAAKGNSNKEIARALSISDQTVKNHLTSIMRKLAVNDRTQAVVYALQQGWIKMHNI